MKDGVSPPVLANTKYFFVRSVENIDKFYEVRRRMEPVPNGWNADSRRFPQISSGVRS